MNYIILTGTSSGLGEALALELLDSNNYLFCISRTFNEGLVIEARKKACSLDYFEFDLNNVLLIESLLAQVFKKIDLHKTSSIFLINNAGTVTPVGPIENCRAEEISQNINVNLVAPMILTSSFITHTRELRTTKRILNISSGAAQKPYYGWSNYCSSKAGLDLFTQCVGVEQQDKDFPVEILSFAPGIIDTKMQEEIRSSKPENFIELERFINFKKEGHLKSPNFVARKSAV